MNTFALTLRKYTADNRRSLLFRLAGLAAASVFIGFILALSGAGGGESQFVLMTVGLGIYACIVASFAFQSMKSPRGRIATLMTPSSVFDKFMARWIVAVPCVWIAVIGAFWLTELSRVALWKLFNTSSTHIMNVAPFFDFNVEATLLFISLALMMQAMFFLGAIVWPRLSFVKTLLAYWVVATLCAIAFGLSLTHITHVNYGNSSALFPAYFAVAVTMAVTIAFYIIAYLRLRESDVADRLI